MRVKRYNSMPPWPPAQQQQPVSRPLAQQQPRMSMHRANCCDIPLNGVCELAETPCDHCGDADTPFIWMLSCAGVEKCDCIDIEDYEAQIIIFVFTVASLGWLNDEDITIPPLRGLQGFSPVGTIFDGCECLWASGDPLSFGFDDEDNWRLDTFTDDACEDDSSVPAYPVFVFEITDAETVTMAVLLPLPPSSDGVTLKWAVAFYAQIPFEGCDKAYRDVPNQLVAGQCGDVIDLGLACADVEAVVVGYGGAMSAVPCEECGESVNIQADLDAHLNGVCRAVGARLSALAADGVYEVPFSSETGAGDLDSVCIFSGTFDMPAAINTIYTAPGCGTPTGTVTYDRIRIDVKLWKFSRGIKGINIDLLNTPATLPITVFVTPDFATTGIVYPGTPLNEWLINVNPSDSEEPTRARRVA